MPIASRLLSPVHGAFLQNILHDDSSLQPTANPDQLSPSCPADIENRAVDLLLGRYLHMLGKFMIFMIGSYWCSIGLGNN